ncbi:hypothetical protein PVAP13_5KG122500 [Panicum virgatum]|uniref:SIAH-type domain-containing protein n=1 Tax=Panicum virgatum TaxID=38727 RepID=A0A8T0SBN0_PANVG|nr:hypothetical protein PVAP13_5KG122500 [Panicum virgatum]
MTEIRGPNPENKISGSHYKILSKFQMRRAAQGSSGGEGSVMAVHEPQLELTNGVSLLHCQACVLPLKPPTFKCEAGHVVCCSCRGKHGQACGRAATYAACSELDAFVRDAKLRCQHEEFGCKSLVVYYRAADHHVACEWAPCSCPAPGCGFLTSPPRLVEHFVADHRWPVTTIRYGAPCKLPVPAPPRGCHVLVGEGDGSVFRVRARRCHGRVAGAREGRGGGGGPVQVRALGEAAPEQQGHAGPDHVAGAQQRPVRRVPGGRHEHVLGGAAGAPARRVRRGAGSYGVH